MKRKIISTIMIMMVLMAGCAKTEKDVAVNEAAQVVEEAQTAEEIQQEEAAMPEEIAEQSVCYEHDPKLNDEAMKDIIENPEAVYGFSPDPESTRLGEFASYDWTDPEVVEKAKQERIEYEKSMDTMLDILRDMRDEGKSIEEMAKAVSEERNVLRLAAYENDPEGLEKVKKSNLDTYGNENGPTPESLYEKYGSWEVVLQKAFSVNMGMDACCGLYDDNYSLYQELGLVD